jgi:hypothetical protein
VGRCPYRPSSIPDVLVAVDGGSLVFCYPRKQLPELIERERFQTYFNNEKNNGSFAKKNPLSLPQLPGFFPNRFSLLHNGLYF